MPGKGRNRGTFAIQSGANDEVPGVSHTGRRDSERSSPCSPPYDAFQEGNRLLATQNPHAAVIALERARELEPDKASVRETLARAYYRSGRIAQAGEEFERAVEIEPVNDYAHFGLGLCLMRRGDRLGARRHLKLAVAMRPDQADYRAALERVAEGRVTRS